MCAEAATVRLDSPAARRGLVQSALDLRRVFVAVLFGGIFVLAARNITDPDFWWHLRTGQYIVETRSVPHTDPFSYTREGQPWVAHEWLSEVLIYALYRTAGWGGLIIGFAAVTTATFYLLYIRCAGRPYLAGILVLLGAFACRPTWGVRPQSFSLLLASILLWLLEGSERDPGRLWWIVPMTLLWANLHAGYSLGIALMTLWLIGSWLNHALRWDPSNEKHLGLRPLALVLLLSALVVILNPNGPRLYSYPFETLSSGAMQKHIIEWSSPDFHRGEFAPLLVLLLAVVVAPVLTGLRTSPRRLLLVCASAYAALQWNRFIPIFVLIATPILSEHATAWPESRGWQYLFLRNSTTTPMKALINAGIVLTLGIVCYAHVREVIRYQPVAEAAAFPSAAVTFLGQLPSDAPLCNSYSWGGYLIWKLPHRKVFIDGRADLYGDEFVEHFFAASNFTGDWKQELEKWDIGIVLVRIDSPLAVGLGASRGWKLTFHDAQAAVLTRMSGKGQPESMSVLPERLR